jgi:hypothetical protein
MKNLLHELGQLDWVSLRDLVSLAEKYNVDKRFVGPEIVTWSTGYKGHIVLFKAKSEGPENVFLKFQRIDLLPPEEILVSADENSRFLEALVDAGLWYFKAT